MNHESQESAFDLSACLDQVRAGDQAASRQLVEHLYPLVIKIARGHLPRRLDEEDLAQEIFMKVFQKLADYRGDAPLEHWVSRMAVNTCLNRIRAEKSRPELRHADLSEAHEALLETLPQQHQSGHPLDATMSNEIVDHLLSSLAPQDQIIIRMLELDNLSVQQVSQKTGWSQTMIRVRSFRARQKLRKQLGSLRKQLDLDQ